ncbi:MAG: hypothetical protein Q4G46_10510 [Propionibacteriaceae bacterium]|nr:hypothetical protein [Propionibacteriaceae bacterium]
MDTIRDRDWLTALFDRHHRQVLAYAIRRVGHDAGEDVLAEVFAVAWDRLQFEASYSRTVVDAVPTQVQRDARRMKCTIDEWGSSCVPE